MKNDTNPPAEAPAALQAFTDCPQWGSGGRFIYDPVTKTRTRLDEEPAAADAAIATDAVPGAAAAVSVETAAQSKKERARA